MQDKNTLKALGKYILRKLMHFIVAGKHRNYRIAKAAIEQHKRSPEAGNLAKRVKGGIWRPLYHMMVFSVLLSLHACVDRSEKQNKELIRSYFEQVWNQGELENIEALTPREFLFHYQGQDMKADYEEHKEVVKYWLNGFPDYHVEVEKVLAEKEMVTARYYFTGTHKGEVLGIAPTGRKIKISGMWMCRVEDGQLVECWEEYDHHSLLQQLKNESD